MLKKKYLFLLTIALVIFIAGCNPRQPTCTDGDNGRDIFNGTNVTVYGPGSTATLQDLCLGNFTITEYYCAPGGFGSENISCPLGSLCVPGTYGDYCEPRNNTNICYEYDGGLNPGNGSNITQEANENQTTHIDGRGRDTCIVNITVFEFYCDEGYLRNRTMRCTQGNDCLDLRHCPRTICVPGPYGDYCTPIGNGTPSNGSGNGSGGP